MGAGRATGAAAAPAAGVPALAASTASAPHGTGLGGRGAGGWNHTFHFPLSTRNYDSVACNRRGIADSHWANEAGRILTIETI